MMSGGTPIAGQAAYMSARAAVCGCFLGYVEGQPVDIPIALCQGPTGLAVGTPGGVEAFGTSWRLYANGFVIGL